MEGSFEDPFGKMGEVMERFRSINWKQIPFVSILLVAVNVLVFMISENDGGKLLDLGDLNISDVLGDREYYRFLTYSFLHAGMDHILNNMIILYFMGTMIEKEIGHVPYAIIYFLSGIGGGMISLFVRFRMHDLVGCVGASAAIFGLDGLLLAMVLFFKSPMPTVTPVRVCLMIALSLYSGFTSENVDNAGHLGGLLTGLLLGAIFCHFQRSLRRKLHGDRF